MRLLNRIFTVFRLAFVFLSHCPLLTLKVNFRLLPFYQAILLPIFVYTKTEFRSLIGNAIIKGRVYPNMIHIGDNSRYPTTSKPLSIWTIRGNIVFGGHVNFYNGTYVYVAKNAFLEFGSSGTFVGSDCKIICRDHILIEDSVEITWGCEIYDTSFHYLYVDGQDPKSLTNEIIIKEHTWIGNNSTINKGSVIPSYSIIASHSMVNKDLSKYGSNCLFAGIPCEIKYQGIHRIWDGKEEASLDKKFDYI